MGVNGPNPRHQARLGRLESLFRSFLEDVTLSEDRDRSYNNVGRVYGSNNAHLGWGYEPLGKLVNELHSQYQNISEATISRVISNLAIQLFEETAISDEADPSIKAPLGSIMPLLDSLPTSRIRDAVTDLLGILEKQIQTLKVFIPIEGIQLEGFSSFQIDDNTVIYSRQRGPLNTLLNSNEDRYSQYRDDINRTFDDYSCYIAIDNIEGDIGHIQEQARQRASSVVSILNLLLASCEDQLRRKYSKIYIAGQSMQSRDELIVASQPSLDMIPAARWGYYSIRRYKINSSIAKIWSDDRKFKFSHIFECLNNPNPKDVQRRMQSAVTWYSNGINGNSNEEKFTSLAIALESLLVGDEGNDPNSTLGSISQRLAERVAFLLGIEDVTKDRQNLASQVKKLYGDRSKIVHSGEAVSDVNLFSLDRLVSSVIIKFASKNFSSWDSFLAWIKLCKYSVDLKEIQSQSSNFMKQDEMGH